MAKFDVSNPPNYCKCQQQCLFPQTIVDKLELVTLFRFSTNKLLENRLVIILDKFGNYYFFDFSLGYLFCLAVHLYYEENGCSFQTFYNIIQV